MRSAVLQFLVAGALVFAWMWMLGRPLLTMLARRSRRDSIDHFRHQQSVLGRSAADDFEHWDHLARFNPIADWRAQPIERRRLQIMLGFAIAAFSSLLMAIALRGAFVRLFVVMTIAFAFHLLIAASIGARELRAKEAAFRRRDVGAMASSAVQVEVGDELEHEVEQEPMLDDGDDLLAGNGIAGGLFDEGFFEPIPELESQRRPEQSPAEVAEQTPAADDTADRGQSAFTTPAESRGRATRKPKARPIYIESELDEDDGTIRAVND